MFLVPVTRHSSELARSFDRLFDDSFERFFNASSASENGTSRSPALDVAETDRGYTATLELPGVAKEDVQVSIDGRRVTVQAQTRRNEEKKDGERVVYRERSVSSFSRSFTLPQEIDQTESNAKLEHGVLTLQLQKRRAVSGAQLQIS